jgi:hypothetical protein
VVVRTRANGVVSALTAVRNTIEYFRTDGKDVLARFGT